MHQSWYKFEFGEKHSSSGYIYIYDSHCPIPVTHRYTGIQVYRYTGIQVYRYTGIQVHRYTGIQVYRYTVYALV